MECGTLSYSSGGDDQEIGEERKGSTCHRVSGSKRTHKYEMVSFSSLTTVLDNNLPTFRLDALVETSASCSSRNVGKLLSSTVVKEEKLTISCLQEQPRSLYRHTNRFGKHIIITGHEFIWPTTSAVAVVLLLSCAIIASSGVTYKR